ncbi:MAG: reverse transcriptase family protein [Pseudomonadota bacterium]
MALAAGIMILKDPDVEHKITAVNGQEVEFIGVAEVDIYMHPRLTIKRKANVAKLPSQEFIIGRDILSQFGKFEFDFQFRQFKVGGVTILFAPKCASEVPAEVFLVEDLEIPARTQVVVPCGITTHSRRRDMLFVPRELGNAYQGSAIASALVHPTSSIIPVCFLNAGFRPQLLHENTTVGLLRSVAQSDTVKRLGTLRAETNSSLLRDSICTTSDRSHSTKQQLNSIKLRKTLNLTDADLTSKQKEQLLDLLVQNVDTFAFDDRDLGSCPLVQHEIVTGDAAPIRQRPYRVPMHQRQIIKQHIDEMLKADVIRPSISPWASPVVLVKKKDGKDRFWVDYRKLNNVTKKDVSPLPRIDEILDVLGRARFFSTLDLRAGYWQIPVAPQDREKTAFVTYEGMFEFNKLPFGLCNAPATFQRLMEIVLAGLNWLTCAVYMDDILVFSVSFEDHLRDVQNVINTIRSAGLKFKPEKCQFARASIKFLGHVVTPSGIRPDPEKLVAVRGMPDPKNKDEVRSFLGLASYYRRFVRDFAQIADPLHKLLKKNADFKWAEQHSNAVGTLKDKLLSAPILHYPDFSKLFTLFTDASGVGIGAVLAQDTDGQDHPIAYISRALKKSERNYPPIEWEALAVVWAIRQFRHYLYGRRFIVITDHAPLRWLMSPNHMS